MIAEAERGRVAEGLKTPLQLYFERLKPTCIYQVRGSLRTVAKILSNGAQTEEEFAWEKITVDDMERLVRELRQGRDGGVFGEGAVAIRTRHTMMCLLSSTRGVLRCAYDLGLMAADDFIACKDVRLNVPYDYQIDGISPAVRPAPRPRERKARELSPTCGKGHPFTPENTGFESSGARYCRTCNREKSRKAAHARRKRVLPSSSAGRDN